MKGKIKSIGAVLGYLLLYGGVQIGIWFIVQLIAMGQLIKDIGAEAYLELLGDSQLLVETLMNSVQEYTAYIVLVINISVIGFIWLIAKCRRQKLRRKVSLGKMRGSLIGLGVLVGVGVYIFDVGLVEVLSRTNLFRNSYSQLENAFKFTDYTPFLVNVLIVGILAPFAEELLFRGVIYQALKKHFHIGIAITIQALLFGLVHLNGVQFVYATWIGILCGYMVYKTGSLWSGVVIHMANNTVSCILTALATGDGQTNGWTIGLCLLIGVSVVVIGSKKLIQSTQQNLNEKSIF